MTHRKRPRLLLLFLLATASVSVRPAQMLGAERFLTFDEVQRTDLTVTFQTDCAEKPQPDKYQEMQRVPTNKNKFTLYFNPGSTQLGKYGTFFLYTFYIADDSPHPASWYECTTQVYPR